MLKYSEFQALLAAMPDDGTGDNGQTPPPGLTLSETGHPGGENAATSTDVATASGDHAEHLGEAFSGTEIDKSVNRQQHATTASMGSVELPHGHRPPSSITAAHALAEEAAAIAAPASLAGSDRSSLPRHSVTLNALESGPTFLSDSSSKHSSLHGDFASVDEALAAAHLQQRLMAAELKQLQDQTKVQSELITTTKQALDQANETLENAHKHFQGRIDEEAEAANYWMRQHEGLQTQTQELQSQLIQRDEMWKMEWERNAAAVVDERDELQSQLEDMHHKAKLARRETDEVKRQVLDLKASIASSTKLETQVTDHDFAIRFADLATDITDWVVQSFRRSKRSFAELPAEISAPLREICPLFDRLPSAARLAVYQALVVKAMMPIFDAPLLYGLPDEDVLTPLTTLTKALKSTDIDHAHWRAMTLDAFRRQNSKEAKFTTAALLSTTAQRTEGQLCAIAGLPSDAHRTASLYVILERAVDLARLFRVQRAMFDFHLPVHGEPFMGESMDEINGAEDDDDEDQKGRPRRLVLFATFPGVIKRGDERGQNLTLRNVVSRAKVACAPSQSPEETDESGDGDEESEG